MSGQAVLKAWDSPAASPPFHHLTAEALLDALGIDSPEDIDIEAIAQHCGVTILYERLSGSEARLIGYDQRAIVTVDERASPERKRFSAAHELGHWMWDRGKMAFCCGVGALEEGADDAAEKRANRYAAELLLPERLLRRQQENVAIDFSAIAELAKRFGTSLTATAIRFVELSPRPLVLMAAKHGVWRWRTHSLAAFGIEPKAVLASPEITACVRTAWTDWFEGPPRGALSVQTVRLGFGVSLSLLHWSEMPFV